jgi:two-component system chemotaxis response regulator CheB
LDRVGGVPRKQGLVRDSSLIVIGTSAGGVEALTGLIASLPLDIPAAVCVVMHFPAVATSTLPRILARAGPLPAQHARHGMRLERGCIYVAPPGFHLLVAPERLLLSLGPRQNGLRPAVDPLFRTAARAYGPRAIGVVLSGTLDDGTHGLIAIKQRGGVALVQDPNEALFNAMPLSALARVNIDAALPVAHLGPELARLAAERQALPMPEPAPPGELRMATEMDDTQEVAVVRATISEIERGNHNGSVTMFTCPDCGGVLWELGENEVLRFRCHVGHAYSADALNVEHGELLEDALWNAVRVLEESASLARRLAHRADTAGQKVSAQHFEARAEAQEQRADVVRRLLLNTDAPATVPVGTEADDAETEVAGERGEASRGA